MRTGACPGPDDLSRNFFEFLWESFIPSLEAGVVKISGYEEKTGRSGQVSDVKHVHMYVGNVYMKVRGGIYPTL